MMKTVWNIEHAGNYAFYKDIQREQGDKHYIIEMKPV